MLAIKRNRNLKTQELMVAGTHCTYLAFIDGFLLCSFRFKSCHTYAMRACHVRASLILTNTVMLNIYRTLSICTILVFSLNSFKHLLFPWIFRDFVQFFTRAFSMPPSFHCFHIVYIPQAIHTHTHTHTHKHTYV